MSENNKQINETNLLISDNYFLYEGILHEHKEAKFRGRPNYLLRTFSLGDLWFVLDDYNMKVYVFQYYEDLEDFFSEEE